MDEVLGEGHSLVFMKLLAVMGWYHNGRSTRVRYRRDSSEPQRDWSYLASYDLLEECYQRHPPPMEYDSLS